MAKDYNNLSQEDLKKLKEIINRAEGTQPEKKKHTWNKTPTPFSMQQLKRLFDVISNAKVIMVCFLALITGMRLNEVLSTKISEIEWELKRINKPITKGGKPRVYYLNDKALEILKKWISMLGDTEYLFPSQNHSKNRVSKEGFYNEYKKYLKKADLWLVDLNRSKSREQHVFNFHTFRSTFCSILVNNRVNIFVAKELMGHSKISTTERHYAYMGDITLKEEVERIFGRNKNKLNKEWAKKELNNLEEYREKAIESFAKEPDRMPERDPLQDLQIKLVNGNITLEEFNLKASAILSVRNAAKSNHGDLKNSYIG